MAEHLTLSSGQTLTSPAAPLLAASLRRSGHPVHIAPLRAAEEGAPGSLRAYSVDIASGQGTPFVLAAGCDEARREAVVHELNEWAALARPRTVLLASPRSFCAGVERAIDTVRELLNARSGDDGPLYVRKQIVHNDHVVNDLAEQGAVFVDELDEVPTGSQVVFSAHGVSPQVRAEASARDLAVVDATCPLVTKVHAEARRFAARGHTIVLIGHADHEEVEGTAGEAPEQTVLVECVEDVATLDIPDPRRVSYLTQTTLAVDETQAIISALIRRYPHIQGPGSDDICYATTNRQHAFAETVSEADLALVIGSANSSNSVRLVEVARRRGTPAHLIEDVTQLERPWLHAVTTIALTAGASAPPVLINDALTALHGLGPVTVREHATSTENVTFGLPAGVRPV
ncbi:4-hydroxy-3-methylbut-2-enyl diphosphate reductase [Streptomyces althioticus]|uniref:4-hydroxy-3-methylbut-2-enyl diphosphate reductase n=1 Tax=Streptomyces althioticus TaxID=83380 RepID=UPI00368F74CA